MKPEFKEAQRIKRHYRIRRKTFGTIERPRLAVHRSKKGLYCQLVDDVNQKTLCSFSTLDKQLMTGAKKTGTIDAAKVLGKAAGASLKAKGITKVAFDRGGYLYHGRIKALAEALREGGIDF